jgi:hypothetical protein
MRSGKMVIVIAGVEIPQQPCIMTLNYLHAGEEYRGRLMCHILPFPEIPRPQANAAF